MAKAAFKIDNNQDAKDDRSNRKSLSKKDTGSKMPTATDLANTTQMRNNCIFCGNGHPSQECYSGQRMHLPEKKDKAKGKNVCFWCLLPGHGFKKCRIKRRCPVCGGRHYPIMCPTLEAQKTSHLQKAELKVSGESPATKQETANQFTSTTLNNATVGGVYLQTLIVKISGPKGKHNVRVLLDCGSQRSYISKKMVDALGLKRVQQVTLTHNLFGGGEIRQKKHNVYKVNVSSLNNEYMDDLKFLDQEVICGYISQVRDDAILNELKSRGINLTDVYQGEEKPILMLIGSDLLSSILTGRMQILQNGVVATETKLGWTVMGPAIGNDMEDSCLIVTSLHVNSFDVQDLWNLDVLDIMDAAEAKYRKGLIETFNTHVKEITMLMKSEDWNHVAGEHNPADLPSRGEFPSKFTKSGWWEGPKWLQEKKEDWPVSKVQYDLEAIEEERRKTVVAGFVAKKPEKNPWYLNLYEGKREVTLTQILRVIAWMLRFKPSEYKGDIISQEELDSAEKSLVKIIQSESIGEEDPKMKQLHAFQDKEALWRVKTRIVNRNDDELFRLPILIPTNHLVTELIVKSVQKKMYHCGAQTLRSVLREKFWIPIAQQLVRHVTGIDLGGPLYLEDGQKVWFVIFTCGVYRAVHLELVTSLSMEALVGAVERFVARRGCPAVIYSDNGTNLVGLRNELYRVNFGVKWKLNPPAAAWWGGWIERIVGLTKKLLRRLLGKRVVNYEEMVTILENCERVINARPLTYIVEDNDDLVPLTPEMFLREPRAEGEIDLNEFRCNFGKSYKKRKRLLKEFCKRFRSEYLGLLVHHDNSKKQRQLKVGDIVLVEVENRKQINWPMGKITKVFPGTDNVRRLVEVKTKSGFMKRAVQRLFPLEVPSEDIEQGDGELKPAEDEIVREKTSGVESASVQEKTTPVKVYLPCETISRLQIVATARAAFKKNKTLPVEFRISQLRALEKLLTENTQEICDALKKDLNKPQFESVVYEIDYLLNELNIILYNLRYWMKPEMVPKCMLDMFDEPYIHSEPYGVALILGAWNYPLQLLLSPLFGAIAAGNCAILKPSEISSATALLMDTLIPKYLDNECFHVYMGGKDETTVLLKQKFDYIFYTGSTNVGKIIAKAACEHLTPFTLELGGKCPVYIDETADFQVVAKRLWAGKVVNLGQTCVAPDFVLCTKSVQDKLLPYLKSTLQDFFGSDPMKSQDLCRIVNENNFRRLEKMIAKCNPVIGGELNEEQRYIAPTVLFDVSQDDPIMQEENRRVIEKFVKKTSSGGFCANDTIIHLGVYELPFGGVGFSGIGKYHGKASFKTFSNEKSVLVRNYNPVVEYIGRCRYPPYTSGKMRTLQRLLKRRYFPAFPVWINSALTFCVGVAATVIVKGYTTASPYSVVTQILLIPATKVLIYQFIIFKSVSSITVKLGAFSSG
ncbi:ALDH3A2 [Cordylochernes scorpioides]|uniref:ALDH3A2 n=1 Tax=Cordylochernes scorpioides TaxID=51811 RepID=A0ABY6LUM6_9ARAC|nr:ALDH3A2 [Cordylochernes scorpioides]